MNMAKEGKPGKKLIPWRVPNCGGSTINGSNECFLNENTNEWTCVCHPKPQSNYFLKFTFINLLIEAKCWNFTIEGWDKFGENVLQKHSLFQGYNVPQAQQIKCQLKAFMKEFAKKHDYGPNATGFETHHDFTPYEKRVKVLCDEFYRLQLEEEKKKKSKESEADKKSTLLFVSSNVLPVPPNNVLLTKTGKIPACIPIQIQKKRSRDEMEVELIDVQSAARSLLSLNATVQIIDEPTSPVRSLGALNEVTPNVNMPVPFPFQLLPDIETIDLQANEANTEPRNEVADAEIRKKQQSIAGASWLANQRVLNDIKLRESKIEAMYNDAKEQASEAKETLTALLQQNNQILQSNQVMMQAMMELMKKKDN